MPRLRLDPTAPSGIAVAVEPSQVIYRGAVAGQVSPGVQSVVAGTNVTVDNTDPKNPIVSATGGGGGGGAVDSVNGQTGVVVLDADDIDDTSTLQKFVTAEDLTTLANTSGTNTGDQDLSALALKTNVLELDNTDAFTPASDYHPATKKYVDDSITAGGGYTDEQAQDAVGTILTDSSEIDFTYSDATPSITASLVAGSIDEAKLDASVNASLDLADSAVQNLADLGVTATATELNYTDGVTSNIQTQIDTKADSADLATVAISGDYNDLSNKPDLSALNDVVTEANLAAFPATGDGDHVYIAEDTGYMYRWNGTGYTQLTDQTAIWGQVGGTLSNQTDLQAALDAKQDAGDYATTSALTTGLATKADTSHSHSIADVTSLQDSLDAKQATLVSGTSIKTINGDSVLGSGDLVIESSDEVAIGTAEPTSGETLWVDTDDTSEDALTALVDSHVADTANPHNVTKTQVGLGSVDNVSTAEIYAEMADGLYPIGTVYTNTTNANNPSTYILGASGQTWVPYAEDRVIGGKSSGGTFGTAGAELGAETHTHPLSNNGQAKITVSATRLHAAVVTTSTWTETIRRQNLTSDTASTRTDAVGLMGTTDAGSTLQPTVVAYIWERVA